MNWNVVIRQIHRWLSIVFTVTVIANFVALARGGGMPPPWVTYSPLLPLALLLFSGLYLFVLPYAARWRSGRTIMKKSGASQGQSASELISKRIAELGDWRGKTLSRMRKLIKEADPDVVEEWKWRDSGLVARRHHLHRRILQDGREADLRQGRVSEGSGPSLQLEPRRKRTPRDRHPRRRRG